MTAPILLRLDTERLSADASPATLAAAIAAANAAVAVPGLPPELTPGWLDPDKVAAFVAGLARLDRATRAPLAGRAIWLGWEALGLAAAAPTRARAFAAPFALTIDETQGETVLAHTDIRPDIALARQRIDTARAALVRARARLRRGERSAQPMPPELLALARRQCAAAAQTWRLNARAWSAAEPNNPDARRALAFAARAAERAAMPAGARAG